MRVPSSHTSPSSGAMSPSMVRSSTVLPEPLPPITARVVPFSRVRLMPRSTGLSSNAFQTSMTSTTARLGSVGAAIRASPEEDDEELGEEEVGDDHRHRHLDHGVGGGAPEPFRPALGGEPVVAADQRDEEAEHDAL